MRQNPHVRICAGARVSNDPGLPDRDESPQLIAEPKPEGGWPL